MRVESCFLSGGFASVLPGETRPLLGSDGRHGTVNMGWAFTRKRGDRTLVRSRGGSRGRARVPERPCGDRRDRWALGRAHAGWRGPSRSAAPSEVSVHAPSPRAAASAHRCSGFKGFSLESTGRCWPAANRARGRHPWRYTGAPPPAGNEKTRAQEGTTTVQRSTPRTAPVRVSATGSLLEVTHTFA